jgi:hypothetical protein
MAFGSRAIATFSRSGFLQRPADKSDSYRSVSSGKEFAL